MRSHYGTSSLLAIGCWLFFPAVAQDAVAERPAFFPGDTWQYEFANRRYAKPGCLYQLTVERVTDTNVYLRVAYPDGCEVSLVTAYPVAPNSVHKFDLSLNPYYYSAEPYRWLEFPLFTGKTWTQSWKREQNGWNYVYEIGASVEEQERVSVAAGDFMAYRIRLRVSYRGTKTGFITQSGRLEDTLWYSPDVKNFVKRTFVDPGWASISRELVSFQVR